MELRGTSKFVQTEEESALKYHHRKRNSNKTVILGDGFGNAKEEIEISREKNLKNYFGKTEKDPINLLK